MVLHVKFSEISYKKKVKIEQPKRNNENLLMGRTSAWKIWQCIQKPGSRADGEAVWLMAIQ